MKKIQVLFALWACIPLPLAAMDSLQDSSLAKDVQSYAKEGPTEKPEGTTESFLLKPNGIFAEPEKEYEIDTFATMRNKIEVPATQELEKIINNPCSPEEQKSMLQTLIERIAICLRLALREKKDCLITKEGIGKEIKKNKKILRKKKYTPSKTEKVPEPVARPLKEEELKFLPLLVQSLKKEKQKIEFELHRVAKEIKDLSQQLELLLQWKVQNSYCQSAITENNTQAFKQQVKILTQQLENLLYLSPKSQPPKPTTHTVSSVEEIVKKLCLRAQSSSSSYTNSLKKQHIHNLSYLLTALPLYQKQALQRIQANIFLLKKRHYYTYLTQVEQEYQEAYCSATKGAYHMEKAERKAALQAIFLLEKQKTCLECLQQVEEYPPFFLEGGATLNQEDTYNKVRLGLLQTLFQATYKADILKRGKDSLAKAKKKMAEIGKIDSSQPYELSPKTYLYTPRYFYVKSLIQTLQHTFKKSDPIVAVFKNKQKQQTNTFQEYNENKQANQATKLKSLSYFKAKFHVIIEKRIKLLKSYRKKLQEQIGQYKSEEGRKAEENEGVNNAILHLEYLHNTVQMELLSLPLLKQELLNELPDFYEPFFFELFQNVCDQRNKVKQAKHQLCKEKEKINKRMNAFEAKIQSIQSKNSDHLIIAYSPRIQQLINETQFKKLINQHSTCIVEKNLIEMRFQDLVRILEERRQLAQLLGMGARLGATTTINCLPLIIGTAMSPVGLLVFGGVEAGVSTLVGKTLEDLYMNEGDMSETWNDLKSSDTVSQVLTSVVSFYITQGLIKVIPIAGQKIIPKKQFVQLSSLVQKLRATPSLVPWRTRIPSQIAIEFYKALINNISSIIAGECINTVLEKLSEQTIEPTIPSFNPQNPHYTATNRKQYLKSRLLHATIDATVQSFIAVPTQELGKWYKIRKNNNTLPYENKESKANSKYLNYLLHKIGHFMLGGIMGGMCQLNQNQIALFDLSQKHQQGDLSPEEYTQQKEQLQKNQKNSLMRASGAGALSAMSAEVVVELLDNHFVQPKGTTRPETQEEWKAYQRSWEIRKDMAVMGAKCAGMGAGYICGNTEIGQRAAENAINNNYRFTFGKGGKKEIMCIDEELEEIEKVYREGAEEASSKFFSENSLKNLINGRMVNEEFSSDEFREKQNRVYREGGERALAEYFIKNGSFSKLPNGDYYCHTAQRSDPDPIQLVKVAIREDKALNDLIYHLIPLVENFESDIQEFSDPSKLKKETEKVQEYIDSHEQPYFQQRTDRPILKQEKELISEEVRRTRKKIHERINKKYEWHLRALTAQNKEEYEPINLSTLKEQHSYQLTFRLNNRSNTWTTFKGINGHLEKREIAFQANREEHCVTLVNKDLDSTPYPHLEIIINEPEIFKEIRMRKAQKERVIKEQQEWIKAQHRKLIESQSMFEIDKSTNSGYIKNEGNKKYFGHTIGLSTVSILCITAGTGGTGAPVIAAILTAIAAWRSGFFLGTEMIWPIIVRDPSETKRQRAERILKLPMKQGLTLEEAEIMLKQSHEQQFENFVDGYVNCNASGLGFFCLETLQKEETMEFMYIKEIQRKHLENENQSR